MKHALLYSNHNWLLENAYSNLTLHAKNTSSLSFHSYTSFNVINFISFYISFFGTFNYLQGMKIHLFNISAYSFSNKFRHSNTMHCVIFPFISFISSYYSLPRFISLLNISAFLKQFPSFYTYTVHFSQRIRIFLSQFLHYALYIMYIHLLTIFFHFLHYTLSILRTDHWVFISYTLALNISAHIFALSTNAQTT